MPESSSLNLPDLPGRESVKIIPSKPCHTNFIYASWLQTFRHSMFARSVKKNVYFNYQSAVIQDILTRSEALCMVDPKDEENLISWAVYETPAEVQDMWVLHYLVVKPSYQRLGIANDFLESLKPKNKLAYFSHKNDNREQPWIKPWLEDKHHLIYNPYLTRSLSHGT